MSTTVTYKGSTLTTVNNETKSLLTKGTWLEDDIEITDTGGSDGGTALIVDTTDSHGGIIREITTDTEVKLEGSKTVTPTSSQQTITPSQGYDGFSSVIVEASSGSGDEDVEIIVLSENLHDSSEDVANTYINGSTETSYNGWTSTGYIPVKPDTYYKVVNTPGGNYNALYKSDKTVAKGGIVVPQSTTTDSVVLIKTTSNTSYIRMSGSSSGVANYEIYEVNVVEVGSYGENLVKHTGSFTPATAVQHFEITGLDNPAIIVLIGIHENALDGTTKFVKSIYANGSYVNFRTNASGTALVYNASNDISTWLSDRTVEDDGYIASGGAIVATTTGFAASSVANGTYNFKAGYTYDWVCYTYPIV